MWRCPVVGDELDDDLPRTQPPAGAADTLSMFITEPLLTELWIVAFCCAVNGTDPYPLHADVVLELRKFRPIARA